MKGYEAVYKNVLPIRTPTLIRCDGRAFRNFTKGFSCGPDNLYNVKRSFDPNNLVGPQYSFPNGRESYEKVYNPNMKTNTDKSFPGPGQYNNTKPFGEDSIKFSLAAKLGSSFVTNRDAPGPGRYWKVSIEFDKKYKS